MHLTLAIGQVASAQSEAGDPERGKAKAAVCGACHGADGNSLNPQWPSLAGQVPGYIARTLMEFKKGGDGERNNAIMAGQAAALSDQDMKDLDAYFVNQPLAAGATPEDKAEMAEAGRLLYRGGDAGAQIPACMSCHSPSAHGVPPTFPRLAGQHAEYIKIQLLSFRAETRSNAMMTPIAQKLTEKQIENLSWYLQGLQ